MRSEIHLPSGHRSGEVLSPTQTFFYDLVRGAIAWFSRAFFRLKVVGGENIPRTGGFILAPSHRSYVDVPLVAPITSRRLRYMGKEALWAKSWSGWFFTGLGGFPVQRGTADREALKVALEVVERGEPLVMFPEGTRETGPDIVNVHDGPSYVAARAGVPIVPVGIAGTEAAMPAGAKMIRPVRIVVVVGSPVVPEAPTDSGRIPRRAVKDLTERTRVAIQEVFDEARRLAGYPDGY